MHQRHLWCFFVAACPSASRFPTPLAHSLVSYIRCCDPETHHRRRRQRSHGKTPETPLVLFCGCLPFCIAVPNAISPLSRVLHCCVLKTHHRSPSTTAKSSQYFELGLNRVDPSHASGVFSRALFQTPDSGRCVGGGGGGVSFVVTGERPVWLDVVRRGDRTRRFGNPTRIR